MKLGEVLCHVSIGQKIRVVFLYDDVENDGDETGEVLEFENDRIELEKPLVKNILNNMIEDISAENDYLRIGVFE